MQHCCKDKFGNAIYYLYLYYLNTITMYKIRYSTKNGGSGMMTVPTNERAKEELLRLYKKRLLARIEKDGVVIGEVIKLQKWNWYLDTEA